MWLKSFRLATTQMSATQTPMLSSTYAIFCGLQEELWETLCSLPNSTSPQLVKGLTDAHLKLSDYYHTFDTSPFYSWSSLLSLSPCRCHSECWTPLVLYPRISYTELKDEFIDDPALTADLEASKSKLESYFKDNYMARQWPVPISLSTTTSTSSIFSDLSVAASSSTTSRSPQKNFTACFNKRKRTPSNELQEFWNLPQEDFDT